MKIDKKEYLEIEIMEVKQPLGTFYIGKAIANEVVKICSVDKRRKLISDELDEYIGIQRELNQSRKREIETFVETEDASFPNSIILSVREGKFELDKAKKLIRIEKSQDSCNILDGQHRLSGFPSEKGKSFELILTLFVELDLEYQSYLFSIINTRSTRINPSLAQDLYAFSKIETPERLAHRIARLFNKTDGNPWFNKIKILGSSEGNQEAIISQSTFCKGITELISSRKDTYEIRNILKKNENKRAGLSSLEIKKVLWQKYLNQEDKYIYDLLKNFFLSAEETFKSDWGNQKSIITKTAGYTALMNILKLILTKEGIPKDPSKEYFDKFFDKVKKSKIVKPLTTTNYKPGQGGERDLYKDIKLAMGFVEPKDL